MKLSKSITRSMTSRGSTYRSCTLTKIIFFKVLTRITSQLNLWWKWRITVRNSLNCVKMRSMRSFGKISYRSMEVQSWNKSIKMNWHLPLLCSTDINVKLSKNLEVYIIFQNLKKSEESKSCRLVITTLNCQKMSSNIWMKLWNSTQYMLF